MQTILILYLVTGLIFLGLSIPLITRKIKPNPFYGFRVRKTLENRDIWYAVNEHLGWRMLVSSLIFLVASLLLYVVPGMTLDSYSMASMFAFLVPFVIGTVQSAMYLKKLAK